MNSKKWNSILQNYKSGAIPFDFIYYFTIYGKSLVYDGRTKEDYKTIIKFIKMIEGEDASFKVTFLINNRKVRKSYQNLK